MWSIDTLRERGVGGFVHAHPWQFAIGVGLVGGIIALSNGVNPLPATFGMFLVGAVLGLVYSYAMDYVTGNWPPFDADRSVSSDDSDPEAALLRLRERYAAGELTDDEFEARLERLLETETIESARDHVSQHRTEPEREHA